MQQNHMNDMVSRIWTDKLIDKLIDNQDKDNIEIRQEELRNQMFSKAFYEDVEKKIQKETINLPTGMRTPTAKELEAMEEYGKWYKQANPKASQRNLKRAICRKFNLSILPDTLNI